MIAPELVTVAKGNISIGRTGHTISLESHVAGRTTASRRATAPYLTFHHAVDLRRSLSEAAASDSNRSLRKRNRSPLSSTAGTTGTFFTLASVKLIWGRIVQRRGRDLKTSVIKL
jgi:hypothetical protein